MRKTILTIGLCLGVLCFSCDNKETKTVVNEFSTSKTAENKVVEAKPAKKVATRKPDTIINGKQIYRFGPKNDVKYASSLEEAIESFDNEINKAETCRDLMVACNKFDTNVKHLINKDNNLTIDKVEQRKDVIAIRKLSEQKSLTLCQAKSMK